MTSITISPLYHRNRAYGVPSQLNCKRTPEHPRGNRLRVITTLLNNVNIGRNEALSRVCGSTWWHCFEAFSSIWSEGIITLRRTPLESSEQSDSERFGSDYAFLEDALCSSSERRILHLHLLIWQMLLSKANYTWGRIQSERIVWPSRWVSKCIRTRYGTPLGGSNPVLVYKIG